MGKKVKIIIKNSYFLHLLKSMTKNIHPKLFVFFILILCIINTNAQDPTRFKQHVNLLLNAEYNLNPNKKLVVFTGSSSIVRWKSVQTDFQNFNVINNGFGGSQFSDLIYFYNELILKHSPDILFIYEGDNDIAKGKKPSQVFKQAKGLIAQIKNDLPQTKIILISPKPCIANWEKKDNYIILNKKLEMFCRKTDNLEFADVWKVMVDENGIVFRDIFVEDGDHMNKKGYDLWVEVIGKFLK